jgi:hypothetical protein
MKQKNTMSALPKKGTIIAAYIQPPLQTRVICVHELGSLSTKTYQGPNGRENHSERPLSRTTGDEVPVGSTVPSSQRLERPQW